MAKGTFKKSTTKQRQTAIKKAFRKPIPNKYLLALFAIAAFALIYSLLFIIGPSSYGDDPTYLSLAYGAATGNFVQSSYIFSVRLMMIFPIALFYKLFGVSLYTDSMWDILCFVGSVIAAFSIGKELYNEKAGILAAFLLSIFPLTAILAPTVSDNIPMMFMTAMAMLSILYAQRRSSKFWYFAAGFFLIASPLVTPEGFIIIPIAVLYLVIELFRRKITVNRKSLHLAYGVLMAGLLLMAFNYLNSGHPLITYTTNSNYFSAIGVMQNGAYTTIGQANQNLGLYPQWMFPYNILQILASNISRLNLNPISIWDQLYITNFNMSGFFFYALVIAALYLIARKERRAYFALFWFITGIMYLEFGPMHFSLIPFQYLLTHRLPRFMALIAVPTALVIAIALMKFADSGKKQIFKIKRMKLPGWVNLRTAIITAIMLFLTVTSLQISTIQYSAMALSRYDAFTIANYLGQLPNTTVIYYPASYTQMFSNIQIYMKFDNLSRFRAVDNIENCTAIPVNSYVVLTKYAKIGGLNYTPDPLNMCPGWQTILYPRTGQNYSSAIEGYAYPFRAVLYYVKSNQSG